MNMCVFDMEKGLLIKLGEDKEVLVAYKGRTKLTESQIKETYCLGAYGSPVPKFEKMDWPYLSSPPNSDGPNFSTHTSYFDSPNIIQLMMGIEMIN